MLAVQVQYWALQETKRHNVQTEKLGFDTLAETHRHNVVTESETYRHNVAVETETQRHNIVQENYWFDTLAESNRHNVQTENIGYLNAKAALTQAAAAMQNAATNSQRLAFDKMIEPQYVSISQQQADTAARQADIANFRAVNESSLNKARTNDSLTHSNYNIAMTEKVEEETSLIPKEFKLKEIETYSKSAKNYSDVADTWFDNVKEVINNGKQQSKSSKSK